MGRPEEYIETPVETISLAREKMVKAAGIISIATLASRILGFIRDIVVARYFGAGITTDAFFVAFRLPNLLRRLLGEGALSNSFIPVFTEYLNQKSHEEAKVMVRAVVGALFSVLVIVSILGVAGAPWIIRLIAPGFWANPQRAQITIELTKIMFPYILFVGLAALAMGILNCLRHFITPALMPIMLNISMIFFAIVIAPYLKEPIIALAIGVLVGGFLQLFVQIPLIIKNGFSFLMTINFKHPAILRIGRLMLPAVFGLAVTQINTFVDTMIASFLKEGSISYLYYADRVVEFPLGVFGIAIATAVLPFMAEYAVKRSMDDFKETLSFALRLSFFITIPATVGLIILRIPIIQVLFERGEFSHSSTLGVAWALLFYSIGLTSFAGVKIAVPGFYSLQDTKTPVKVGAIAVIINVIFSLSLMGPLQHGGLALATTLAATFNFLSLLYILRKRIGSIGGKKILESSIKIAIASSIMGLFCLGGLIYYSYFHGIAQKIYLLAVILIAVGIYIGSCIYLKCQEWTFLYNLARKYIHPN